MSCRGLHIWIWEGSLGAMTKAHVKAKYDSGANAATATLSFGAGDLKLKASCANNTFKDGGSLHGVSVGVEKPGSFMIDYDLHSQVGLNLYKLGLLKRCGRECLTTCYCTFSFTSFFRFDILSLGEACDVV